MELVFDLALLDEDGISDGDAHHLYLLSARALKIGDTEREYHEVICTSPARIYDALFSERVLSAVRVQLTESYRTDTEQRVKVDDDDVEGAIHDQLTPLEF